MSRSYMHSPAHAVANDRVRNFSFVRKVYRKAFRRACKVAVSGWYYLLPVSNDIRASKLVKRYKKVYCLLHKFSLRK